MGNVNVTLGNGALGSVLQTQDGIAGMVLNGTAEGTIVAGTPFLITSLQDAITAGLTTTNNPLAYKNITDFYANALNEGAQLYIMLVPDTMTVAQMADKTNTNGAIKLLQFAGGKVRILGIMSDDAHVYSVGSPVVTTNGINADVYTAVTNIQALAQQFFLAEQPFRAVIGGTSFTGTASSLSDLTTEANNRVAVLIGDTVSGANAALGLCLGTLAAIPVQRKISRVKNGPLNTNTAFIATTSADQYTQTDAITSKGFITFKAYQSLSGFFFTGDPTATTTTDDYAMLARGRVIDKAHLLAYATFVQEVDDEAPVDPKTGLIDPGFALYLQQQMENQINLSMVANNNCSGVTCFIDPNQNVLSTSQLNVTLKITPVGYATTINVTLSFDNPANG
ncbi:MAG TPA: DUF2586 family protein [Flavipsychrobacter sp.]|nr:DUF2586 family protein [Flavipsychrobacter sp.]